MKIKYPMIALALAFVASCAGKRTESSVPAPTAKAHEISVTVVATTPAPSPTPAVTPSVVAPSADVDVGLDSPTRVIQRYTEELRSMVDFTVPKEKRKNGASKEQEIAQKVRQFFDFPGLARMSLGSHWMKINASQKEEFSRLFINLIEDSYLRRTRDLVGEYQMTFGAEEVRGNRAKVICKIARNDADLDIVYELHKNPTNWMIFNIDLDGVDLIRNYQSQFNSIIGKYGFEGLMSRMRKKLEDTAPDITL